MEVCARTHAPSCFCIVLFSFYFLFLFAVAELRIYALM